MGYADKKCIPFVALVGESEIANNVISVKDMESGTQINLTIEELIEKLK
jgi:histidyl-tRNA synthetase